MSLRARQWQRAELEPSRAEPSRAEQSRAEQSRAELEPRLMFFIGGSRGGVGVKLSKFHATMSQNVLHTNAMKVEEEVEGKCPKISEYFPDKVLASLILLISLVLTCAAFTAW